MPATARPEPSAITKEVAAILTGVLARRGLEQQELAAAVGISRSQISRMLAGNKHWDVDQLDVLDVLREASSAVQIRGDVSASTEDDEADIDITSEVRSAWGRAAHKGPRKADVPYAD
jgi:transcriptional regulator with XRE-family HTH domain